MTVKEFVEKYECIATDDLKRNFIKRDVINNKYVPYLDKCTLAEDIVKKTTYEMDKDKKTFTGNMKLNSPARALFATLFMVQGYTNIDIKMGEASYEYDMLMKCGAIKAIFEQIPQEELDEFSAIINMTLDDLIQNEFSTQKYFERQVDKIKLALTDVFKPIIEEITNYIDNMSDEEKQEFQDTITKKMNKMNSKNIFSKIIGRK